MAPPHPLQARGREVSHPARGEHEGVPEEVPAPAAPGGEEGPGTGQGRSLTSHHSRQIWAILIHSMVKVSDGIIYEQVLAAFIHYFLF